jgi:hypothetical protein
MEPDADAKRRRHGSCLQVYPYNEGFVYYPPISAETPLIVGDGTLKLGDIFQVTRKQKENSS